MEQLVLKLKALADTNRMKIVILLSKQRICVKGLSKRLGITEAAVSQHIKILKQAEILVGEKVGYYIHYHVRKDVIAFVEASLKSLGEGKLSIDLLEIQCQKGACQ